MSDTELVRNDLAQSAAALRSQPLLVAITLGLGLAPLLLVGLLALLVLPLLVFEAGFVGTTRIWFLRAFRGMPLRNDEIWPLTRAFIGRMIVLGLITGVVAAIIAVPIMALGAAQLFRDYRAGQPMPVLPGSFLVGMLFVTLCVDVALTFVVPALSFTTRSVGEAFRLGFRMIGETWPASALFVLMPGLAASFLGLALPASTIGRGGLLLVGLAGALFALWFKGAIAAMYLRLHPETPNDGSAHPPPPL